jgi:hypothetical protein
MRAHLWLDAVGGAFLAASPFLLNFHQDVWAPQVAFGLFEIMAAGLSRTNPAAQRPRGLAHASL